MNVSVYMRVYLLFESNLISYDIMNTESASYTF